MMNLDTPCFPFKDKEFRGLTADSMHFKEIDLAREVMVPLPPHVGAFGVQRKFHVHEGVDLYCIDGDPVFCMETGTIKDIIKFTGAHVGTPWWANTYAVLVEGPHGIINYGELEPNPALQVGKVIRRGELVGNIIQVLIKDKGRPMSMLHLELYDRDAQGVATWRPGEAQPTGLKDPTPLLSEAAPSIHGTGTFKTPLGID